MSSKDKAASIALLFILALVPAGGTAGTAARVAQPSPAPAGAIIPAPTQATRARRSGAVITGRVVGVSDGDTVTVLDASKRQHRVRLLGIDAPEKDQDFGQASKRNLSDLVFGREVTVEYEKQDRYGRTLGKVMVGGRSANLEQVRAGLAWFYRHYAEDVPSGDRQELEVTEGEARRARKGLWVQSNPTPPWDFRRCGKGTERVTEGGESPTPKAPQEAAPAGRIIGNRRSMIYHRPDCPNYHQISPANRVYFGSRAEAERAGYREARNCP